MRKTIQIISIIVCMLNPLISVAAGGLFFNATVIGSKIHLTTTIPNHTYTKAGIKIDTNAFTLSATDCTPISNGYCLFSVSNTLPANITIAGPRSASALSFKLCLNGRGPDSCQNYTENYGRSGGSFAYISNLIGGNVSICKVDQTSGLLSQCNNVSAGGFSSKYITINQPGTYFYIGGVSSGVTYCALNAKDGSFADCRATWRSDKTSSGFAFNPDGTLAYITSLFGGGEIAICPVSMVTGEVSTACIESSGSEADTASGIILNPTGIFAYIANFQQDKVTRCLVNSVDGSLQACIDAGGTGFSNPNAVAINPDGTYLYVTNFLTNSIRVCAIDPATGQLNSCTSTAVGLSTVGAIAFNLAGTKAYVPNDGSNTMYVCDVDQNTGSLIACVNSGGAGFVGPGGIALK